MDRKRKQSPVESGVDGNPIGLKRRYVHSADWEAGEEGTPISQKLPLGPSPHSRRS